MIGSGIGGLTAATWLAKAGEKVAVLERHYMPGGFLHSFERKKGFKWDVGVHYVGNVPQGGPLRKFFDLLTDSQVEWEPMGDPYDVVYIGEDRYEFRVGREAFREQMVEYFPREAKAIDAYLKLVRTISKRAQSYFLEKTFKPFLSKTLGWILRRRFYRYTQRTTDEVLKELTDDQRLRAVLSAQCGNYGLSPKSSDFAAHAIVIDHFMDGGYYPVGGSDELCEKTLQTLTRYGGSVYLKADVRSIVTEKDRVQGVDVAGHFIPCKSVISDAGADNTFTRLLGEKERKKCGFDLSRVGPSTGHMCLYLGLDRSDEELQLPRHNIWYFDSDDLNGSIDQVDLQNAPEKFAYITFPSAKDPAWKREHPGTSTLQALSIGRFDWFAQYQESPTWKRGEAYEKLKERFKETMLQHLYRLFPQIKGHVVITDVSTPLTTRYYSNYKHGEIYGLEHTSARFKLPFLRPETRIKGLRLTGQDITTVGVAGAMLAGVLCSITILKFRVWRLFREMARMEGPEEEETD